MELKQTLPTTKVKALQKLQELKLIKPMLHKQTLVQILPDKITKLLVLQGTQTAGTGQTAPTTATGDTRKPHAKRADQGNGATVTPVLKMMQLPSSFNKTRGNDWSRCHLNQVLLKTIVQVKVLCWYCRCWNTYSIST